MGIVYDLHMHSEYRLEGKRELAAKRDLLLMSGRNRAAHAITVELYWRRWRRQYEMFPRP